MRCIFSGRITIKVIPDEYNLLPLQTSQSSEYLVRYQPLAESQLLSDITNPNWVFVGAPVVCEVNNQKNNIDKLIKVTVS